MATWDNGIPKNQPLVKHINHEEITDLKVDGYFKVINFKKPYVIFVSVQWRRYIWRCI